MIEAEAIEARALGEGFAVLLASGEEISARKAILAFGLRDMLEPVPGLQERWGKTVLHCPYCHGFEFADRPLGVLFRTPMSAHQACLITDGGQRPCFSTERTSIRERGTCLRNTAWLSSPAG